MDASRFDALTRSLARVGDRRAALRGLGAGAAALAGLGLATRAGASVNAQVDAEGDRGPGKACNRNSQCGTGLRCKNGACEYKGRNCGRTGDTCDKSGDCCGNRTCRQGACER
jgi:hypothetical protein